jgi:hypothetical protein
MRMGAEKIEGVRRLVMRNVKSTTNVVGSPNQGVLGGDGPISGGIVNEQHEGGSTFENFNTSFDHTGDSGFRKTVSCHYKKDMIN